MEKLKFPLKVFTVAALWTALVLKWMVRHGV